MSTEFFLLASADDDGNEAGEIERERCADDLDRAILDGTPRAAHTFLTKWGEPLRALLNTYDVTLALAREGHRHAA